MPDLTPRQAQIAFFVLSGYSRQEMATALTITKHTVDAHLRAIYTKTGARNMRKLAILLAREEGTP